MSFSKQLITPIHFKTSDDMPLPTNEVASLLLSSNGLWMCRNHEFFQSCAPARSWPCELAEHKASLRLQYPKIPQRMLERIVGFFSAIAERHEAEAGVLLIWNKTRERMEVFDHGKVVVFEGGVTMMLHADSQTAAVSPETTTQ